MVISKNRKAGFSGSIFFIVFLCFITSGWFRRVLFENSIIAVLFLLNSIIFSLYYFGNKKISVKLLFLVYGIFLFFQFKTTNIKNAYSFTPSELDLQITRMNYYPPSLARLGYILERKKEVKVLEKVPDNFIEVVDFNQYFPNYFFNLTLPLFLIGVFWFVKGGLVDSMGNRLKIVGYLLLFSIFTTTLLGVHGKYGPFLLFPFVILFILIGVYGILKNLKVWEKR